MSGKLICLIAFLLSVNAFAQSPNADKWHGYERSFFTISGHTAYFIKPVKALAGNPWIWRASFPDWHTGIDSILLSKGFYVAYVNVDDQYGNSAALQVWDKFYTYLNNSLHLSDRPALEAVSRGALYALGWAKRNPDKVSCIYAETPVYDFKSWPGGKGKGPGDADAWKQLKAVYHFTEEQAMTYNDNPVDHLEGLAAFKVPVINVIGIHDQLAPRAENSDVFVKRYTELGGPVSIYPVTDSPQELQGHHFPIKNAGEYAGLIYNWAYPARKKIPYDNYYNLRSGIGRFYHKIIEGRQVTVAFLGGSITFNPGWRQKICAYLQECFPETKFKFIAAGIPSLGSLPHAFRLQRDVLDSGQVDLMFVEAAVNDRVNKTDSLTQVRDLEGIIRHAKRNNPAMDIVMMEFADPDKTRDYDNGIIPAEITNHELIAAHYQLPSINLAKEVHDKLTALEFSWEDDFKDLHPAPFGQELYFASIKSFLQSCFQAPHPENGKIPGLPNRLDKYSFTSGCYYDIINAHHDRNWKIDQQWKPADNAGTRDGFVNVPVLEAEKPGATLTLPFKGDAIGIAVLSGPDAGILSYSIDGTATKHIDLYTEWSNWLHLPWYVLLDSGLREGDHNLKITIDNSKNKSSKGNACRIVYFFKNN